MNITTEFYLNKIASSPISNWRTRAMITHIEVLISGYRLTAMKSKGYIREHCNREANYLESRLKQSKLSNKKRYN